MQIKAFAYMRCSGLGQVDGDTWNRQRAAISDFAEKNNLEIVSWYEERGISGKNDYDARPAMQKMFAEFNGVRTVVVERLDRVARDLIVQESIIARLQASGIELLSTAEDNICSDDPTRVFIRQVLGAVAALDRGLLCKKLRAARDRKRANGERCEGRKRYGRDDAERAILAIILEKHAAGFNAEGIAWGLNLEGIKTRTGKEWRGSVIRKILRRESDETQRSASPMEHVCSTSA